MTREDASKILRSEIFDPYTGVYSDEQEFKAHKMAIKALEQEPCPDAISRQAVLDLLVKYDNDMEFDVYSEIFYNIDKLPPVNAQPTTGHWIDIMVGDMPAQACDRCNAFFPLAYTGGGHHYCPNCGAKMVDPQDKEG